jgi:signal transduction histidine kinase
VVTEVVKLLQSQARAHDLTVHVNVARNLPLLRANRELLINLVRNLLSNALKFSRPGGRVELTARQQENFLIFQVSDQGIGISADETAHLFEKFYRGATAKAAGIRGTGLGLVLTKEAVMAHGGTISVESQLGLGTCFTITLPVGDSVGAAERDAVPIEVGRSGKVVVPLPATVVPA